MSIGRSFTISFWIYVADESASGNIVSFFEPENVRVNYRIYYSEGKFKMIIGRTRLAILDMSRKVQS